MLFGDIVSSEMQKMTLVVEFRVMFSVHILVLIMSNSGVIE